jgi:hypothetical protein
MNHPSKFHCYRNYILLEKTESITSDPLLVGRSFLIFYLPAELRDAG